MITKTAYQKGMFAALVGLGLVKQAEIDDPSLQEEKGPEANNPAEMLAQIFQTADQAVQSQGPDNKTERDVKNDGKGVKWGPRGHGTGLNQSLEQVPGLNMPDVSSI